MASGPNLSANVLEAGRLVRAAAQSGAGLVVLPENFAFMGQRIEDCLALREQDGEGKLQSFLSCLAARHGVWLVGGTIPLQAHTRQVRAARLIFNDRRRAPVKTRSCSTSAAGVGERSGSHRDRGRRGRGRGR
jgi:nitrilase